MLERLSLEEALLRHTQDNWILVGTHDVWPPKYLRTSAAESGGNSNSLVLPDYITNTKDNNKNNDDTDAYHHINRDCMIVMGIGGKPDRLLNIENVVKDKVLVVKRFSGGGTVVMDHNSVWTTLIGRTADFPTVEPYPRSIMQWSADAVFGPAFDSLTFKVEKTSRQGMANSSGSTKKTLVMDTKSCSPTENVGKVLYIPKQQNIGKQQEDSVITEIPKFSLRENDYVLGQDFKMGGNAQSIIKGGWLHHTSFLWDYEDANMEDYLQLPDKRPEYRQSRSHRDFLVPLSRYFGKSYTPLVHAIREACDASFDLQETTLPTVVKDVIEEELGGMEAWFGANRTRIVGDMSR
jgi:lipoate-protein ligase A